MPASYRTALALVGGAPDDERARLFEEVAGVLGKLDAQLAKRGGPYFLGREFSLVDAAYAPFFRRWRIAERWGGPDARLLERFPKVSAWADALLSRASVAEAEPAELEPRSRKLYAERAASASRR